MTMKKNLHITATLDQPELLEEMVEKLAIRSYENSQSKIRVPKTWEALETSSLEAFVSGVVEFDYNEEQRIRIPFVTCLVFSCTKTKNETYDLCWVASFN